MYFLLYMCIACVYTSFRPAINSIVSLGGKDDARVYTEFGRSVIKSLFMSYNTHPSPFPRLVSATFFVKRID